MAYSLGLNSKQVGFAEALGGRHPVLSPCWTKKSEPSLPPRSAPLSGE